MSFASEAFGNVDQMLEMLEGQISQGQTDLALRTVAMLRGRLPSLLAGIDAERDRLLERPTQN